MKTTVKYYKYLWVIWNYVGKRRVHSKQLCPWPSATIRQPQYPPSPPSNNTTTPRIDLLPRSSPNKRLIKYNQIYIERFYRKIFVKKVMSIIR